MLMHIRVYASAEPGLVRDISFRVAGRLQSNITLAADKLLRVPGSLHLHASDAGWCKDKV